MGDAGVTPQSRGLGASQNAPGTQTQEDGGQHRNSEEIAADWYKIVGRLTEIGGELAKLGANPLRAKV